MTCGFGYWQNFSAFDHDYRRKKWADGHLGRDIEDPERRQSWIRWELANLARDVENARRRDAVNEASDLAYYANRLRGELGFG